MNGNTAKNKLLNICEWLGKDNKPVYAVMAIATFKAINRPTFTLMDKKQPKKDRKYAALREGLTEAIALVTYFGTYKLASKVIVPAIVNAAKKKQVKMNEDLLKTCSHNIVEFLGVCISAVFVIPFTCNLLIGPAMKAINKHDHSKQTEMGNLTNTPQVMDTKPALQNPNKKIQINTPKSYPYTSSSLKVGG